jgi:hypothetical protein
MFAQTSRLEKEHENSTLHHRWRVDACDAKLNRREELIARQYPRGLRICKCNICRGEKKSLQKSSVVAEHLHRYGRTAYLCGSTNVRYMFYQCPVLVLYNFILHVFTTNADLLATTVQGIPSDDSDNEWDDAII